MGDIVKKTSFNECGFRRKNGIPQNIRYEVVLKENK